MSAKKNIHDVNEIDLVEVIIIILKNKLKIFIFTFLALILMLTYLVFQNPIKPIYKVKAEVKPISKFDEFEYLIYNSYLKNMGSKTVKFPIKIEDEIFIVNEVTMDMDFASFVELDRLYLINLFMQKINDNEFIEDTIKEFELINSKNYEDKIEYKNSIKTLLETFRIAPNDNIVEDDKIKFSSNWIVKYKINNKEVSQKFLEFLDQKTNLEVQNYIQKTFNNLVKTQQEIKRYNIEDIEIEILNATDEDVKKRLEITKEKLKRAEDIERLLASFKTTPVVKSDIFFAAKIMNDTTEYKNVAEYKSSNSTMIILSIVFGALIGIIFVLISSAIKQRK